MTDSDRIYCRYQDLQLYVGWTEEDDRRVRSLGPGANPTSVP